MKEIHLYVECCVPTAQIHELITDKYHLNVSFDEVYRAALQFGMSATHAEKQSDSRDFIYLLSDLKKGDERTRFAYEFAEA